MLQLIKTAVTEKDMQERQVGERSVGIHIGRKFHWLNDGDLSMLKCHAESIVVKPDLQFAGVPLSNGLRQALLQHRFDMVEKCGYIRYAHKICIRLSDSGESILQHLIDGMPFAENETK